MNILIIANADHSGAGYALAQAINGNTKHKARAISFKRSKLLYPYDVLKPSNQQLQWFLNWADVINCHDEYMVNVKKPIIMTYHGSWYRGQQERIDKRDKKNGYVQTVLTLDLANTGAIWIGRSIPDMSDLHKPGKHFTFVHCPTKRYMKGTNSIIGAFKDTDLKLVLVENQTNKECLKNKARCHVLIDQIGKRSYGYGTNSLEAWTMGMPVISSGSMQLLTTMEKTFGYLPFLAVYNRDDIVKHATMLRDSPKLYQEWHDKGRYFIERFHSPKAVSKVFTELCERIAN